MQQTSKLPEGWAYSTLDTIGKWATGGTPSRKVKEYFGVDIPWIKSGDLNDSIVTDIEEKITKKGLDNCSAKLLPEGTISIALYGATIGKLGIFGKDAATNQACANCIPNNSIIHTKFLFYYLFQQRKTLIEAGQGGAQPNLTNRIVREWPLSLPPLADQHRIVSAIEALFARLDVANERLDRVLEILKRFRQSVLVAACEGRLTEDWREENPDIESAYHEMNELIKSRKQKYEKQYNEAKEQGIRKPNSLFELQIPKISDDFEKELQKTWAVTTVGFIGHVTKLAGFEYTKYFNLKDEGDIPVIRAQNVQMGKFIPTNLKYISKETSDALERSKINGNEVLIVYVGAGVGNVCLAPSDSRWHLSSNVGKISSDWLSRKYLMYFLQSEIGIHRILDNSKATAQPSLSMKAIRQVLLSIPPLPEQHEIVRRVDAVFALADSIEAKVAAAREKTEKLRQSILAKAFSGELVPTEAELARREGRDYEPADVLLERIKAEQGKSGKKGKAAKVKSTHGRE